MAFCPREVSVHPSSNQITVIGLGSSKNYYGRPSISRYSCIYIFKNIDDGSCIGVCQGRVKWSGIMVELEGKGIPLYAR